MLSRIQTIASLSIAMLCVSCTTTKPKEAPKPTFGKKMSPQSPSWAQKVDNEVAKLGNFNWIVIADPAFPALNRDGLSILTLEKSNSDVLEQVFNSMDNHGHVQPKIYLTRESKALTENETPGIEDYRSKRDETLKGREARYLTNGALELLLLDAKKKYRILIIKTNSLLPYSSVFLELESGYWDGESESSLRKRMKR